MTTFYCIVDGEPPDVRELLRRSCLERYVMFETVRASSFDFAQMLPLVAGDLLYRVATTTVAGLVETHMRVVGISSFRADRLPPQKQATPPFVPSVICNGRNRGTIRRAVDTLGGLPVVVKIPGGEAGVGVMIAESWRALVSLLDYLSATGVTPTLSRFLADADHWRCITLGNDVIASYLNEPLTDDFRTIAPQEPVAYRADAPESVCRAALEAAHGTHVEFAGVDVLIGRDHQPFVIEVNSPCNFSPAQINGGTDISGAIVDYLLAARSR